MVHIAMESRHSGQEQVGAPLLDKQKARQALAKAGFCWLRELDLNQRPSGYEPDELPGCSIPRQRPRHWRGKHVNGFCKNVSRARAPATMPGDDLLFHRLSDSTIGAVRFHGRVRDGIGWGTDAIATKQ